MVDPAALWQHHGLSIFPSPHSVSYGIVFCLNLVPLWFKNGFGVIEFLFNSGEI